MRSSVTAELRSGPLLAALILIAAAALACGSGSDAEDDADMTRLPDQGQDVPDQGGDAPDQGVEPQDQGVEPQDQGGDPPDMIVEPDMTQPTSGWTALSQPCGGTKADAFWFDDASTGYIGCGTNAQGAGLFKTSDGGQTWTSQRSFMGVRVNDVRRGPDGKLYGAGYDMLDGFQVFHIDEAAPTNLKPVGLYKASRNAFTAVGQGENIAITQDGQLFVDSLTGTQSAYRAAGAAEFVELGTFLEEGLDDEDAPSRQMSQVIAFNDRFWAVGSIINQPAVVFVPSALSGATYHMKAVDLQPASRDGEMHDLHVWSETSAIVVGFDQSTRFPFISRLDGDPRQASSWSYVDVADSGITYQGGIWNLHVQGDRVVVVGQTFPKNEGFVLLSDDRGQTWRDISPLDERQGFASALMSNVWMFEDGTILAAAEGGQLWRYNP